MSEDVYYPYALLPSATGRPPNFDHCDAEPLLEVAPNPYLKSQYVPADPYETVIDNCPKYSESSTNTEKVRSADKAQLHREGGWPNAVDVNEPEELNKYARRLCRDDRHVDALRRMVPQLSAVLRINGALDIYEPLFEGSGSAQRYAEVNPKAAAVEAERSRRLCPWRHEGANAAAGSDDEDEPTGSNLPFDAAVGSGGNALIEKTAGGGPAAASSASATRAMLSGLHSGRAGAGGAPPREMADIAYSDPNVVHALHVSCKLSIPVLEDDKIPIHGTTASQSRYTCGSDSTKIVVGYCEGILPSRVADAARYAGQLADFGSTVRFGGGGGGLFGSPSAGSIPNGSVLFNGTFDSAAGRSHSVGNQFLNALNAVGLSSTSARRSTAVSPLFRNSAVGGSSGGGSRKGSRAGGGGLDDESDENAGDLMTESMRPSSQSAAFILRREAEEARAQDEEADEAEVERRRRSLEQHGNGGADNFTSIGRRKSLGFNINITPPPTTEGGAGAVVGAPSDSLHDDARRATASNALKRQLSSLNKQPGGGGGGLGLGGTYSLAPLNPTPQNEWGCAGAMWSTTDPSAHTNLFMSCNGGATSIVASYRDPNIVHGGMSSGLLEVWDIRRGPKPVATSGRDESHRDAVTCVKLVTTKATECFSCGLDGQVLFWDTRRLANPIFEETVQLKCPTTGTRYAATGIDFDPLVGGTLKYLVSTVEGKVISCGRRANRQGNKILGIVDAHYGTCFSAMRCPAVPKVFATCGDWGFKLLGDELKSSAIYNSPLIPANVLCGIWHPTRHSIFVVGSSSGDVYFYDILRTAHGHVMKIRASSCAICHLEAHVTGRTIAATDAIGEVHILTLPSVLYEPTADERLHVVAALEREYGRERVSEGIERAAAVGNGGGGGYGGANDSVLNGNTSSLQVLSMTPSASPVRGGGYSSPTTSQFTSGGDRAATNTYASGLNDDSRADREVDDDEGVDGDEGPAAPLLVSLVQQQAEEKRKEQRRAKAQQKRNSRMFAPDVEDDEEFGIENDDEDDDGDGSGEDEGGEVGAMGATYNRGKYTPAASPHVDHLLGLGGGGDVSRQHYRSTTASPQTNEPQPQPQQPASLAQAYLSLIGVGTTVNPYAPPTSTTTAGSAATVNRNQQKTASATSAAADDVVPQHQQKQAPPTTTATAITTAAAGNAHRRESSNADLRTAHSSGLFGRLKTAASAANGSATAAAATSKTATADAAAGSAANMAIIVTGASASGGVPAAHHHHTDDMAANKNQNGSFAFGADSPAMMSPSSSHPTAGGNSSGGAVAATGSGIATDAAHAHSQQRERRGTRVGQRPSLVGGAVGGSIGGGGGGSASAESGSAVSAPILTLTVPTADD